MTQHALLDKVRLLEWSILSLVCYSEFPGVT